MSRPGSALPLEHIKPAVREMAAYTLPPRTAPIKANQNENPWDLPQSFKDEVLRRMGEAAWCRYPDFVPTALFEALAGFSGWRPDGVLAGNGSNELIQVLLTSIVGPRTRVVIPEPTFTLYRMMSEVLGGEVVAVPLRADMSFDAGALLRAALDSLASVLVVCSPNNPTGSRLDEADLRVLLAGFDGIVVLDEAYHEFCPHTAVPLLREYPNLVVFRTFSKAMAMAGLRLGYLMADPALVREFEKVKLPYNVSRLTGIAGMLACERYETDLRPSVERLVSARPAFIQGIAAIPGLRPFPSEANFVLVESLLPPKQVVDGLWERGVLARDVSRYPMLSRCFRVGLGTDEENRAILAALRDVMGASATAPPDASAADARDGHGGGAP